MTTTRRREPMRLRTLMLGLMLGLMLIGGLLAVAPVARSAESGPDWTSTLKAGDEAFLEPVPVKRAQIPGPLFCDALGSEDGRCFRWDLKVGGGGERLRVAISALLPDEETVRPYADFNGAAPEMMFQIHLLDANGEQVKRPDGSDVWAWTGAPTAYAAEFFYEKPPAGTYRVLVVPDSVIDMQFRLRAKLEDKQPHGPRLLNPNLRTVPPFEFSFYTPTATYAPGVPRDTPEGACMAEEVEETVEERVLAGAETAPPTLCLRFSLGFENVGDGPFWLGTHCPACEPYADLWRQTHKDWCELSSLLCFPPPLVDGEVGTDDDFPLTQVRVYSDRSGYELEPFGSAGTGRFHAAHAHVHYQNAYLHELFQVSDPGWVPEDGKPKHLELVGPGGKIGLFPGDEMMTDWERFFQAKRGSCPIKTCQAGNYPFDIRVNEGWADIYEWNRGGNYVDFPLADPDDRTSGPRPGYYLVRGTSDPDRRVIESNDQDNSSYALIQVTNNRSPVDPWAIDVVERGYGDDPWGAKTVATVVP